MNTKPKEFKKFIDLLLKSAPKKYVPHLFRLEKKSKAPKLEYGSWKDQEQRLSAYKAMNWLKNNGNIGIAGMPNDPLVNVDIDDNEKTQKKDLKPTLMTRSRSRTGLHTYYFSEVDIPNIPTDDSGEIRAKGQYVVAPGSYVPCDKDIKNAGYYTVEEENPIPWIKFDDLPDVFLQQHKKNKKNQEKQKRKRKDIDPKKTEGEHSSLYDIDARDVVAREGGSTKPNDRWTALFHDSSTGMNMSLSDGRLLHCWRHLVSHNGLQALTVLSGYMTCQEAGSPHHDSNVGPSRITNDDGAIFHAWRFAKKNGYIPEDDKVPTRALNYIARKHDIYDISDGRVPKWAYNIVLSLIEEEY